MKFKQFLCFNILLFTSWIFSFLNITDFVLTFKNVYKNERNTFVNPLTRIRRIMSSTNMNNFDKVKYNNKIENNVIIKYIKATKMGDPIILNKREILNMILLYLKNKDMTLESHKIDSMIKRIYQHVMDVHTYTNTYDKMFEFLRCETHNTYYALDKITEQLILNNKFDIDTALKEIRDLIVVYDYKKLYNDDMINNMAQRILQRTCDAILVDSSNFENLVYVGDELNDHSDMITETVEGDLNNKTEEIQEIIEQ
ncbi:hypothetical protein HEP_00211100 [Hepatocystis sp. ex Piliocolobus tephrosceles]|nr:hypothetical protein HEP_00211100 [Hepatocystis sp. ex Piliocolobus tephrosceles]